MSTHRANLMILFAAAALAASCSGTSSPATPSPAASPAASTAAQTAKVTIATVGDSTTSTPVPGQVKVCKVGNVSGTFTVTTSGLGTVLSPVTIAPGACEVVAEYFLPGTFANITVTETSAGFQSAQSVESGGTTAPFTNGGTLGINQFHGYTVTVTNNVTVTGTQGCTPGYWKQDQHFDSWPAAYSQSASFNATFGIGTNWFPNSLTLLDALAQGGGGANALGRHATAALLNGASGFYPLTVAQVIARVQATYAGTYTIDATQNYFAAFNNTFCPLN